MVRLLIIGIVAFLVFVGLRGLLAGKKLTVRQFFLIYLASLAGLILLFLGATGRLHPIFAVLGAVLPFLMRSIGIILQGAQVAALVRGLKSAFGVKVSPPPQSSEISSRYIHMILFHDTGMMDGTILEGRFKDRKLAQLELDQLLVVLDEIRQDADSYNLLVAYLDREHGGWQQGKEESAPADPGGELTESQALDILGLDDSATRDDIVSAHRRMMQKVHPDRGGSTYLATKINAAKDLLMRLHGK